MSIDHLGTIRTIEDRRSPVLPTSLIEEGVLPAYFPMTVWSDQIRRYSEYWRWWSGQALIEIDGYTQQGDPVYRYPLQINPIRNFSRKHASILLGEVQDGPNPAVKSVIQPLERFDGEKPTEGAKKLGKAMADLVNRVWEQSGGRALQQENATLSQFLGGCVFQLSYAPDRDDLAIPLTIKNIVPDFFLPIWNADNPWDLVEAFVIYRLSAASAKALYGDAIVKTDNPYAIYVEHWTKKDYSVTVDGMPLRATYERGGVQVELEFKKVPNPFGHVPFYYFPKFREGDYYGPSIVEDIRGLVKELNSALADLGDSIKLTVHRRRYVSNIGAFQPTDIQVGKDNWAVNIGNTTPTGKHEPKITVEDPPSLSEGMSKYPTYIWEALLREANLSDIYYGKDEGSQRSALTLAFRMLPTTSQARATRSFWEVGLNRMAYAILRICSTHKELARLVAELGLVIPKDFSRKFRISQDWASMVPRDREQEVGEIILRTQTDRISPELALEKFGDVPNIEDEIQRIKDWMEFRAQLEAKYQAKPQNGSGTGDNTAKTDLPPPVASTGLND